MVNERTAIERNRNNQAPVNRAAFRLTYAASPITTLPAIVPVRLKTETETPMTNNPRLADLAVNEVMETQQETRTLLRLIDEALSDGNVTPEEALRIRDQAREVKREADEDVLATERTNIGELLTVAGLTGTYNKRLLTDARNLGLQVVIPQANVVLMDDYREPQSIA